MSSQRNSAKKQKTTADEARRVSTDTPAPKSIGELVQDLNTADADVVKAAFKALDTKELTKNEKDLEKFARAGGCFVVVQAMKNHPDNPVILLH